MKKIKSALRINPHRDWYVMVLGMFVLLVVSAWWNLWIFTEIGNGRSLGGTVSIQTTTPDVKVSDVQDVFKTRAEERVHYQSDYTFIDPSVPGS